MGLENDWTPTMIGLVQVSRTPVRRSCLPASRCFPRVFTLSLTAVACTLPHLPLLQPPHHLHLQSAFFYGFLLMQIPGSILTTRLGGANVLPRGVSLWSCSTACVPFFATNMPVLCALRYAAGDQGWKGDNLSLFYSLPPLNSFVRPEFLPNSTT